MYYLARSPHTGGRAHWPCWTGHRRKFVGFCPHEQMRLNRHLSLGQVRDLFALIINHLSSNTESDIGAVHTFVGSACALTNAAARQAMDLLDR